MRKKLKHYFNILFRNKNKLSYLSKQPIDSFILDVGCGKIHNAIDVKSILPKSNYTGIDVYDYNSKSEFFHNIDEYIVTNENNFSNSIHLLPDEYYDIVISSHNLEHCFNRVDVIVGMCEKVKKGGSIFLCFPSKKSISFPSRFGTLNYYDDETHQNLPPDPDQVIFYLKKYGFEINYFNGEYRPLFLSLIGFFVDTISKIKSMVMIGTWEYYGFETIIHAKKIGH